MRRPLPSPASLHSPPAGTPPGPVPGDEAALAAAWQAGLAATGRSRKAEATRAAGQEALGALMAANEGLVHALVRREGRARPGTDRYDELCGAARLALVEAAGKWDGTAVRFGTYAAGAIRRALRAEQGRSGPTTVPHAGRRAVSAAHLESARLAQVLGREATLDEVRDAVRARLESTGGTDDHMSRSGYDRALADLETLLGRSGAALVGDDGDELHPDATRSGTDPTAEEACERAARSPLWDLGTLLGRDWAIFCALHGLDGGDDGERAAARRLGVSVGTVRTAAARVRAALASPAVQWALWAPGVAGCFDELPAMDASPSALVGAGLSRPVRR